MTYHIHGMKNLAKKRVDIRPGMVYLDGNGVRSCTQGSPAELAGCVKSVYYLLTGYHSPNLDMEGQGLTEGYVLLLCFPV